MLKFYILALVLVTMALVLPGGDGLPLQRSVNKVDSEELNTSELVTSSETVKDVSAESAEPKAEASVVVMSSDAHGRAVNSSAKSKEASNGHHTLKTESTDTSAESVESTVESSSEDKTAVGQEQANLNGKELKLAIVEKDSDESIMSKGELSSKEKHIVNGMETESKSAESQETKRITDENSSKREKTSHDTDSSTIEDNLSTEQHTSKEIDTGSSSAKVNEAGLTDDIIILAHDEKVLETGDKPNPKKRETSCGCASKHDHTKKTEEQKQVKRSISDPDAGSCGCTITHEQTKRSARKQIKRDIPDPDGSSCGCTLDSPKDTPSTHDEYLERNNPYNKRDKRELEPKENLLWDKLTPTQIEALARGVREEHKKIKEFQAKLAEATRKIFPKWKTEANLEEYTDSMEDYAQGCEETELNSDELNETVYKERGATLAELADLEVALKAPQEILDEIEEIKEDIKANLASNMRHKRAAAETSSSEESKEKTDETKKNKSAESKEKTKTERAAETSSSEESKEKTDETKPQKSEKPESVEKNKVKRFADVSESKESNENKSNKNKPEDTSKLKKSAESTEFSESKEKQNANQSKENAETEENYDGNEESGDKFDVLEVDITVGGDDTEEFPISHLLTI